MSDGNGMTLTEAIEEVKRQNGGYKFCYDEFRHPHRDFGFATAIATILNAVVKGELRAEEKQDPYWKTY